MAAKRGRKPLVTAALQKEIRNTVKMVGTFKAAACKHGVSILTLRRARQVDPLFDATLKDAQEEFKYSHLLKIANAGSKDWKASAWLLERKFPEEYGKRNADSVSMNQLAAAHAELMNACFEDLPKKYFAKMEANFTRFLDRLNGPDANSD